MKRDRTTIDQVANAAVTRRQVLAGAGRAGAAVVATGLLGARATGGALAAGRSGVSAPALHLTRTSAQAQVSGEISLAYLGTADQAAAWESLFGEFKKTYPNVTLKAQANPVNNWAGFFDAISTQIAGGKVPDIIQVATEGQRLFASRKLVEPIDDLLERDKGELADFFEDIHPNLIEWNKTYSSPDGQTYYLPGEFNTMCVWYNADLLNKAGVGEPADDWSWDDFLAIAEGVTKTGPFGFHAPAAYFVGLMPWMLTNGASTLSTDWKTATVDTPQAIEAAAWMRSLVEKKISPAPGGAFDPFTAAAQDKLAMFGGGRWPVISMRRLNAVDKMKIAVWPQKTQKGSPVGWNAYPIMKGTKNREAAWAFVKFIASKQASEYFATQGGTIVPPRRSVANSDAFLTNAPAGSAKLYEALEYATPIPSPDKGNVVQKDIEDAWEQILVGNVEPEEALNTLNEKIQANL